MNHVVITAVQRAAARAHCVTSGFQRRLRYAQDVIVATYDMCAHPYVAYSAGKDSSVLLHLIAAHQPNATARMLTGGETRLLFAEIDEVFAWWRSTFPRLDFGEINVDHVFAEEWKNAGFWEQYDSFKDEWTRFMHAAGSWDGVVLGLRSEESRMRRRWNAVRLPDNPYPIRQYSENRNDARAGVYVSCPLAYWTTKDVESYMITHAIPTLAPYYRDGFEARTHTRVGQHAISFGQLAELRRRDAASYHRLVERFPELARLT